MGAPTATIFLENTITADQITAFQRWLQTFSQNIEQIKGRDPYWRLDMDIGLVLNDNNSFVAKNRSFEFGFRDLDLYESEELEIIQNVLGYLPQQKLELLANANDKEDHYLLGYLTLRCAGYFNAWINMRGVIQPEFSFEKRPRCENNASLLDIRTFVGAIPGHVYEVRYDTTDELAFNHVVDKVFLQHWLEHPQFHMIK